MINPLETTIIPEGFRLTIFSWENDFDNYREFTVNGIEKSDTVRFYIELCKLLRSKNDTNYKGFGNMYQPTDNEFHEFGMEIYHTFFGFPNRECLPKEIQEIFVLEKYEESEDQSSYIQLANEVMTEILFDFFGPSEDYETRVFEGFKVEYIPKEIAFQNITGNFM